MKKVLNLNSGVVIFSLLAAGFWFKSACVSIPMIDQTMIGLTVNPAVAFNVAMQEASWYNAWAAGSSCIAAFLLAVSSVLSLTKS